MGSRRTLKRVALLIESSRAYGRGLLQGIARYIRIHGNWSIFYQECRLGDLPEWLGEWQGDGIIARVENRRMAEAIRRKGLPAVDVRGLLPDLGLPVVDADNAAIVRAAMELFLRRGFKQVAFCGFAGADYSDTRSRCMEHEAKAAGLPCHIYSSSSPVFQSDSETASGTFEYEQQGLVYEPDLEQWLLRTPKPIGLLACNDIRGQQVLNACRRLNLAVPDQVAVLGVDNDRILCELSSPPLSSIEPDTLRTGYEAAVLLDKMMTGAKAPERRLLIPPIRVVERRSTDVLAVDDPQVAAALRFIRERAAEDISVEEVARKAGFSRRLLERRFRTYVGHTPKAELLRVRLERAKSLLLHTNLTLGAIAEKCGFRHTEYFHAVFKRKTGATPAHFRAQGRL
ncbi:MAG: XylR family transcriptional regulator [Verrucomicrobia bacterium]|nr:XylR family transcriptional regulator [Verrucomicrobiota bacterium]